MFDMKLRLKINYNQALRIKVSSSGGMPNEVLFKLMKNFAMDLSMELILLIALLDLSILSYNLSILLVILGQSA